MSEQDYYWMQQALDLAVHAEKNGEVPVGAVLVRENQIIGQGWNQPISNNDPTAHAEIMALREGANHLNNYRLLNTTLYVTLEPCMMCLGAMIHARISRLLFATKDPRTGVVTSALSLLDSEFLNHRITWEQGILAHECSELLKRFFQNKR